MATNDVTRLVPNQKVDEYTGLIAQSDGGAACIRSTRQMANKKCLKNLVGGLARSSTREIIAYIYLRGKLNNVTS